MGDSEPMFAGDLDGDCAADLELQSSDELQMCMARMLDIPASFGLQPI